MRHLVHMKSPISWVVSFAALCLVTFSCREDESLDVNVPFRTEPIAEDFSSIADPRARWAAYNLSGYVVEQSVLCFCPYPGDVRVIIEGNRVTDVIRKSDGVSLYADVGQSHKTVDELFAFAGSVHPDSVADLRVEYDARFGFPRLVYIDYDARIIDEERGFQTDHIERLIR